MLRLSRAASRSSMMGAGAALTAAAKADKRVTRRIETILSRNDPRLLAKEK
jgi:hypothetical protein